MENTATSRNYVSKTELTIGTYTGRWVFSSPFSYVSVSARVLRKWNSINPEYPIFELNHSFVFPYTGRETTVVVLRTFLDLQTCLTDAEIKDEYLTFNMIMSLAVFHNLSLPLTAKALAIILDIAGLDPNAYFCSYDEHAKLVKNISCDIYNHALMYVAAEKPRLIHAIFNNIIMFNDANETQRILDAKNSTGRTALSLAAIAGHRMVVNALLDAGATINATTASGNTALMHAVTREHTDVVTTLLNRNASLTPRNLDGKNAFDLAIEKSNELIKLFLCKIIDVTREQQHYLLGHVYDGNYQHIFEYIAVEYPLMFQDIWKNLSPTSPWFYPIFRVYNASLFISSISFNHFLDALKAEHTKVIGQANSIKQAQAIYQFYLCLKHAKINFIRSTTELNDSKFTFKEACTAAFIEADHAVITQHYYWKNLRLTTLFFQYEDPFMGCYRAFKRIIQDIKTVDYVSYVMVP